MKSLLKAFRNFFIIFAIIVVAAIVLSNSEKARTFVTPKGLPAQGQFEKSETTP